MCFAVNFVKFLRAPFLTEYLRWLFLAINSSFNLSELLFLLYLLFIIYFSII